MISNLPPIFIISLKNSPRRKVISHRLNGLSIPFEFFDGIYGKDLSQEQLKEIDYEFYPQKYLAKKPLTLGEIGCAMSHIQIYEYIVKNNIQQAIILEDDAIVAQDFAEIAKQAINKAHFTNNDEAKILFFDHGKVKSWFFKQKLPEGYRLAKYRSPSKNSRRCIIMASAYLINLNGAKNLVQHAYPIRMPADYLTGLLQLNKLKAYGVEPPCVFRGVDSEINEIEDRYAD